MPLNYFEQLELLAAQQGGYFYPWASALGAGNGEDAYTALVEQHLTPTATVLEAGSGHGSDLLAFAPKVARFIGYDAVGSFTRIARRRAAEAGLTNVELITHNSSAKFNAGAARIPAADQSVDLIISRRGPGNWIADARRVCRPGARLIQLNPWPRPSRRGTAICLRGCARHPTAPTRSPPTFPARSRLSCTPPASPRTAPGPSTCRRYSPTWRPSTTISPSCASRTASSPSRRLARTWSDCSPPMP
jgi:SAM-dependent methyltransferase